MLTRFLSMILVIYIIVTVTFFLMHAIPGGPFTREKELPEPVLRNLERYYKLDQPLWRQYLDYLVRVARWDFGPSFRFVGREVNQMINEGFPVSAGLGGVAIVITLAVGIPAGVVAALKQYGWQDNLAMFLATLGVSIPVFVLATVLMFVFALKLRWFPGAMWGTWKHAVLPALALAGGPTAFVARLMRSSMLEVLQQDFIRTARAKGMPQRIVIYRHAIRNAIIPVVTYLGPLIAALFTGTFVVEHIFAIPGLGKYYVYSIYNRDYTTIMGVTVFYSVFLVIMNFLVDVAYAYIDPRISLTEQKER